MYQRILICLVLCTVGCASASDLSVGPRGTLRLHLVSDSRSPAIYVDDQFLGHAEAAPEGRWSKTLTLPAGRHRVGVHVAEVGYHSRRVTVLRDPNAQDIYFDLRVPTVDPDGGIDQEIFEAVWRARALHQEPPE